ncbi:hypothetical protein BJS_07622 [Bradyrhizobium japonicum SEMIA 5079]|uniref:Uncharacterized protein n=2 Tax=Bradyrhizobium diazoefficiens TaxID=1355477 RepID=A0A837CFJ2_9BRAD|nr:hypothetical protein BJS_07622 [Bradyrhizobium japonicum SEMIA 5079]KGJ67493.1 hypothetical protein BJA5080_07653 [Bradyrhizobium diazoefficiens SEMIA 5080]
MSFAHAALASEWHARRSIQDDSPRACSPWLPLRHRIAAGLEANRILAAPSMNEVPSMRMTRTEKTAICRGQENDESLRER